MLAMQRTRRGLQPERAASEQTPGGKECGQCALSTDKKERVSGDGAGQQGLLSEPYVKDVVFYLKSSGELLKGRSMAVTWSILSF